jgi:GNAT superfamily N-acetyltransferase
VVAPGTGYHHSNIGWNIAGLVTERVAGAPLPAVYDQRIFSPLKLRHTTYQPQGPIDGPHTEGYLIGDDGSLTEATAWTAGKGADGAIVTNAAEEAPSSRHLSTTSYASVNSSSIFTPPQASIQEAARATPLLAKVPAPPAAPMCTTTRRAPRWRCCSSMRSEAVPPQLGRRRPSRPRSGSTAVPNRPSSSIGWNFSASPGECRKAGATSQVVREALVNIGLATEGDFGAFVGLAAEVEDLFGPMVGEPGFHDAVRRNISRRSAFLARGPRSTPAGGLLFSPHHHPIYVVGWFVVAERYRSKGLGKALLAEAFCKWVTPPCTVEAVTFGPDHPGARARRFYERLGFHGDELAEPGPEGGSRQVFRMSLDRLPGWAQGHGSAGPRPIAGTDE